MRQWHGIDPQRMCRKHLLGEHVEHHMLASCVARGKNLLGYIARGLYIPGTLLARHEALAKEMLRRGYKHNSPLVANEPFGLIDGAIGLRNQAELASRCADCRKRGEASQ